MNKKDNSTMTGNLVPNNDHDAIEARAWTDYLSMRGKIVLINAVSGFVGSDSCDVNLDPPAKVRIDATAESSVKRWNDCGAEVWCDPYWEVSLIEPHPQLDGVRSLWIHGTCYLRDSDRTEPSDVVEIVSDAPPLTAEAALEEAWERYDFGKGAHIEDMSGWEHTTGTSEWTRPVYLEVDKGDDFAATEKVTFTVRLKPDNVIAEAYAITSHGNIVGSLPPLQRATAVLGATQEEAIASAPVSLPRAVATAATAMAAFEAAALNEGDMSLQIYHLLANLHELSAHEGVDLDEVWKHVRSDIDSGEIDSPLWNARQHALRRKMPRYPGTRG